jgi:superfamily II RNA helicase
MVRICRNQYPHDSKYGCYFESYPYPLSDFQKYAIEAIVEGHHVLVTAHTGSGKTLPAEFAIEHFVKNGKRVIYTSPIKALSNQKYSEFSRKYPHISFGLMTGDIKINPEADVLIMTTEILMNALFLQTQNAETKTESASTLQFQIDINADLACVVFDEVHYINDADRGQTWEKTILMLPKQIQMVMLSATIDAPERFAKWAERGDETKQVYLASTNHRVVPLTHYGYLTVNDGPVKLIKDKAVQKDIRDNTHNLILLQDDKGTFHENGYKTLARMSKTFREFSISTKRKHVLNNLALFLRDREMLPAISFVFSRKLVEACAADITVPLLEDDSKVSYTVRRECEQIVRKLPNFREYLELPEYNQVVSLLERGIGIHHSGMIPILREIVEIMISKKYVKLLFATESFAIGLDCPIRTAIFSGIHKFDGRTERILMAHEYTQMAGRAGRRGIDTIGHVVHCNNLFDLPTQTEYAMMLGGKPQSLVSKFRISYSLVLNLLKNGKTNLTDYVAFVRNSMVNDELNRSIVSNENRVNAKRAEMTALLEKQQTLKTPIDVCKRCIEIEESLPMTSNKARRQLEKEHSDILKEYVGCMADTTHMKRVKDMEKEIQTGRDELFYLEHYIDHNVGAICDILTANGYIERDGDVYSFTDLGRVAASIAEIHPLATAKLGATWEWFRDFSTEQMIGWFACFTDVNIPSEMKRTTPHSDDAFLKKRVEELDAILNQYSDEETHAQVYTGIQYTDAVSYDMPDLATGWCKCETELECKIYIQNNVAEKGISVGDFTKALLKVSTIARELSVVAESFGQVECLHKLSHVDSKILKYVTTAQSLYV